MRATRRVAKSGQISLPPEIIDIFGIEAGDYVEIDVIGIVKKASEIGKSEIQNPQMPTLEPILA
jgi:bifunctional DNA-binding transcriptional regulator/antitoxin component of YhaV-PrlF toxin-antitoxin module